MKRVGTDRRKLSEEAAVWLVRLEEDTSPEAQAEFDEWLRLSARHVEEFLLIKAVATELDHADRQKSIDAFDVAPEDKDLVLRITDEAARRLADDTVHSSSGVPPLHARRTITRRALGTVVAAAALLATGVLISKLETQDTYTTAVGNQTTIKLFDGSVMHLNTRSKARVSFSNHAREIQLLEGEAMFTVEHDAQRPFRVITESATIEAIGTQFNVYRQGRAVRVSVVEGRVQIVPERDDSLGTTKLVNSAATGATKLVQGEEAEVAGGTVLKIGTPDIDRSIAWRARRLVFRDEPLGVVVAEFNRYNRVQILLQGDPSLHTLPMSGVFDADDPEPLLRFLAADESMQVERRAAEIMIRLREEAKVKDSLTEPRSLQ